MGFLLISQTESTILSRQLQLLFPFYISIWSLFFFYISALRPCWLLCCQCRVRWPHKFNLWHTLSKTKFPLVKVPWTETTCIKEMSASCLISSSFPIWNLNDTKRKCYCCWSVMYTEFWIVLLQWLSYLTHPGRYRVQVVPAFIYWSRMVSLFLDVSLTKQN